MAHKWSEIRDKMSPERRERNREKTAALLLAMDLAGLRDNMDLTQKRSRLGYKSPNRTFLDSRSAVTCWSVRFGRL
jgi:hypothetical protein